MKRLEEILEYNKNFVENKDYEMFITSKHPEKKMVILSCMDTRLTKLLPAALNIKNGDAKIIKNAGATSMHAFGSIMRSIIVAIYEFNVEEVLVVGHDKCGMCNLDTSDLIDKIKNRGISEEVMNTLNNSDINIEKWLHGFNSIDESVCDSVNAIKNHPLVPNDIFVHGLIMCPETGKLEVVVNGYEN